MTYKQVLRILFNNTPIETIDYYHETQDYFEITGRIKGDRVTYLVYKKNGSIYIK